MNAYRRPARPAATVHAALCRTRDADLAAARMLAGLVPGESRRYRELATGRARIQYLASRWLLRTHLGEMLAVPAGEIGLDYPAGAAPRLRGRGWRVGLSHSGGVVFCAVCRDAAVGCDVERHRQRPSLRRIASSYFDVEESNHLGEVDDDRRLDDFYRLWTLKEAGKKALGLGLSSGLTTPSFDCRRPLRCRTPPGPGAWVFASARMREGGEQYSLGLAANTERIEVVTTEYGLRAGELTSWAAAFDWERAASS